jgi:hypothetical protein
MKFRAIYQLLFKHTILLCFIALICGSCRSVHDSNNYCLVWDRFDEVSNLTLDTIFSERDTIFLEYTDHTGYYDPYAIDEQFLYLVMVNEDFFYNRNIRYVIHLENSSESEPSLLQGNCVYEQIMNTTAYAAFTRSSFYRRVLKQLYSSKYYPYHFLMLNWYYGYELSIVKDPDRFYQANSTELIRNYIINRELCDPVIDSIWNKVLSREMKIESIDPQFDREKKDLLISITNYRLNSNIN